MRPAKTVILSEPPSPIDDGDPYLDPDVVWVLNAVERATLAAGGRFRFAKKPGGLAVTIAPPRR